MSKHESREARDRELIARIRCSDEDALGELFRVYHTDLTHFVSHYLGVRELALDAIQDVFTTLWIKRDSIKISTTVASYLYGAIRHRCLNLRRHERVIARWEQNQTTQGGPEVQNVAYPDVDAVLLTEVIEHAIQQLPPRTQEVFRLCRDGGLSHQEIAEMLGISVNAVSVTMTRALKSLHDTLRDWL